MLRRHCIVALALGTSLLTPLATAHARAAEAPGPSTPSVDRRVLPIQPAPFAGRIADNATESVADPALLAPVVRAPAGAPNVLLIMTDDVGFGASSTFGGPIPTPTFDRIASMGVRYNRFHTTAMCSPTRAALLTGRNHHNVGFGILSEMATGFPGYDGRLPKSAATVARILRGDGYSTAMFGKHHNVPPAERSAAGPFDRWPNGLGFDYFYGFMDSETNQWAPAIVENGRPIEPDYRRPEHFDAMLADHAIRWLRDQSAADRDKPFFVYYATGSAHAPHQAPKEWIERFRGKFDEGWDRVREDTFARQKQMGVIPADAVLTPRTPGIPAWSSLSADQRKVYARMMEVYAAALAHADYQIGRVLDELAAEGRLSNTLIVFIEGDNGSSAEGGLRGMTNQWAVAANKVEESTAYQLSKLDELGGPKSFENYPVGWAWAMNTPFQWDKQIASHFGGTRNGMAIAWQGHVPGGGAIRSQFADVDDIVPTILEAAGLPAPSRVDGVAQQPMDGVSLVYSFASPAAPSRHRRQYFELMGNRAIVDGDWMASTTPKRPPWRLESAASKDPINDYKWELYDLSKDFSQAHDLASSRPEKLQALQRLWLEEARRNNVLSVDDRYFNRPRTGGRRLDHYEFQAGDIRIPAAAAPDTGRRSWTLAADLQTNARTAGVLATFGGRFGGWSLYVRENRPTFVYALSDQPADRTTLVSSERLTPGKHSVGLAFDYLGPPGAPAAVKLLVDGKPVASGQIPRTAPQGLSIDESFDVGADSGTAVDDAYAGEMPFAFNGLVDGLRVDLKP